MSRNGFTRTDLVALIVIAVATVVMATRPALAEWPVFRARQAARRSDCRANLHNIGLGLGQWQADYNQNYPVTVDFEVQENMIANAWGRIYSANYCRDEDVFVCPATPKLIKLHNARSVGPIWTANAATVYGAMRVILRLEPTPPTITITDHYNTDYMSLLNTSYNYDNGRIHKVSAAGRIIAGDALERQWMCNTDVAYLDSGRWDWADGAIASNHDDGANVAYDDKAVAYTKTTANFTYWTPIQTDATVADAPGTSLETEPIIDPGNAPMRPCIGDKTDWVRQGVIQNGRIEEDKFSNSASEHDDAYACEMEQNDADAANIDAWWLLSEYQFETGLMNGSSSWTTDGAGYITGVGNGPSDGVIRVEKHKTDASIQPFRHFRPGTGRPDNREGSQPLSATDGSGIAGPALTLLLAILAAVATIVIAVVLVNRGHKDEGTSRIPSE